MSQVQKKAAAKNANAAVHNANQKKLFNAITGGLRR
jgi:hypothetical protein